MAATDEKAVGQPISPVDSIQYGGIEEVSDNEKGVSDSDVDDALKFLGTGQRTVFTPEQNAKLLRKIGQSIEPCGSL